MTRVVVASAVLVGSATAMTTEPSRLQSWKPPSKQGWFETDWSQLRESFGVCVIEIIANTLGSAWFWSFFFILSEALEGYGYDFMILCEHVEARSTQAQQDWQV